MNEWFYHFIYLAFCRPKKDDKLQLFQYIDIYLKRERERERESKHHELTRNEAVAVVCLVVFVFMISLSS